MFRDFLPAQIQEPSKLSVILMTDSFVFSAVDDHNVLLGMSIYDEFRFSDSQQIERVRHDGWFDHPWQEIRAVVWGSPTYIVQEGFDSPVPDFPGLENKIVCSDLLKDQSAALVFGISSAQQSFLQHLTGSRQVNIHHAAYVLSQYLPSNGDTWMLMHFEKNTVCILCQKHSKLVFLNTFDATSTKDILYFALAVLKDAGLEAGKHKVLLSGWIDQQTQLFQTLEWYLKASVLDEGAWVKGKEDLNSGAPSQFLLHQSTWLCESSEAH
jgi:hypothetical protein